MFDAVLAAAIATPAPQHLPTITIRTQRATLTLQVAKTEAQRERGLMSVTKLAPHTGMVFVFEEDAPVEFWMKDTLIPLDMIFVGADCVVRRVFSNVPVVPLDTPDDQIPRRDGTAKFVIELPANEAPDDQIIASMKLPELCAQSL
jgi:uncharacterized membrane protein (UPF0127 family)